MQAFDVMGQNRLADRQVVTTIRAELLECLVRSRLALPFRNEASPPEQPRIGKPLSLPQARSKLEAAAPLNWPIYVECLGRGTASYATFPPGSCSTAAHPQADLFRAFLRPYLRGQVLDVGCGPQPLPWYLRDYPLTRLSGIDPISAPGDHPFHFVPGFGEFLPWDDAQFDVVVSGTSLDHYYLLDVGLHEVFRVLRAGGHFLAWISEFAGAPPYDPYSARLEAPHDPEHLFHIDRAWFLPLMSGMGFVESEVLHFELPFNYLFMSFEKPASQHADRFIDVTRMAAALKPASVWPRSLHVGNVANVAYGYAKILARRGAAVDLICHDVTHLMSQPEWDDLALDPRTSRRKQVRRQYCRLWDYRRPAWFNSEVLRSGPPGFRSGLMRFLRASCRMGSSARWSRSITECGACEIGLHGEPLPIPWRMRVARRRAHDHRLTAGSELAN